MWFLFNLWIVCTFVCSNSLRVTKSGSLESTEGSKDWQNFALGKDGVDFEFGHLKGFNVQFVECSAKEQDLEAVQEWLAKYTWADFFQFIIFWFFISSGNLKTNIVFHFTPLLVIKMFKLKIIMSRYRNFSVSITTRCTFSPDSSRTLTDSWSPWRSSRSSTREGLFCKQTILYFRYHSDGFDYLSWLGDNGLPGWVRRMNMPLPCLLQIFRAVFGTSGLKT